MSHVDPSAPLEGKPTKESERNLKRESRTQLVSFIFMIFITSTAFLTVASDIVPTGFAIPFILLLASIQVIMQLYVFMHMNHGSRWINVMMWAGLFVAAMTVAALMILIGVTKY
ncbi:cytochrome C oxidase subunit IV family protein [Alkalicoccus saliphilus]|jgi:cytochrome c oxidase subunit IV|uniref:Cytochrome-c oxidase n=1 Tax=Alkalicoccus saliphilus TaxID=200989 RepID=A0A2T4U8K5_9BACI|nr:cytochrome C oxidase subunit IV family protein [Alkalicoccus saliphilus]PTL39731.1 cytochrome-c oxidase [Alkalicoccus saliphilus]